MIYNKHPIIEILICGLFRIRGHSKTLTIADVNILKMADMQQIDVIIERHKWGWIGHTLRKDESLVTRQAIQWNPLDGNGRRKGRPCETWRRTVPR